VKGDAVFGDVSTGLLVVPFEFHISLLHDGRTRRPTAKFSGARCFSARPLQRMVGRGLRRTASAKTTTDVVKRETTHEKDGLRAGDTTIVPTPGSSAREGAGTDPAAVNEGTPQPRLISASETRGLTRPPRGRKPAMCGRSLLKMKACAEGDERRGRN
jgi:hypothetical protein